MNNISLLNQSVKDHVTKYFTSREKQMRTLYSNSKLLYLDPGIDCVQYIHFRGGVVLLRGGCIYIKVEHQRVEMLTVDQGEYYCVK